MTATLLASWSDWALEPWMLHNEPWRWALLLGMLLGSLVVGKVLAYTLVRHADRLGARPGWETLEILLRAIEKPAIVLILAGGLHVSRSFMVLRQLDAEGNVVLDLTEFWDQTVAIIASLAMGWLIYRLVDVIEQLLLRWTAKTETRLDDQLVPLIRKSLRVFVVIIAVLFVAKNAFDADIGALLAGLGLGGLAFALAAKDTIANLFGSVTIFADRPFRMGERIRIQGFEGTVEEVGFRSTRIRTLDGHLVTIPNATVASETIENVARRPFIRRVLNVTVTYDTPPEKLQRALEILREMLAARSTSFPEDRPPRVYFSDFNADSLNLLAIYWFTPPDWWDFQQFNDGFNMELLRRFNDEGIEFAFPTQTLYVKQDSPLEASVRVQAAAGRGGAKSERKGSS